MENFKLHPSSAVDLGSSSPTQYGGFRPESSNKKITSSHKGIGLADSVNDQKTKSGTTKGQNIEPTPPHKIGNKNESDYRPVEWQNFYEEADKKYTKQCDIINKLNDDFNRRQQRYMKREQEYRKYIEDLQRELRIRLGYEVDAFQ